MSKALAKIPPGVTPEKMENMLVTMRRKARNEKMAFDRFLGRFVGFASGAAGAAGMAWVIGTRIKNKQSTKVGGADMELIVGPVLALVGAVIQSKTKKTGARIFGEFVEGMGSGVFAYYVGSRVEQAAAKALPAPAPMSIAA